MPQNWMLILGVALILANLIGLITGCTTVSSQRRGFSNKPIIFYEGRTIPFLLVLDGGALIGVHILSHNAPIRIVPHTADMIGIGITIVAFVLGVVMTVSGWTGQGGGDDADSEHAPKPVSLHEAAKYLHLPEAEVLEMAQNGGIESRQVNGQYMFDKEILGTVRDMLSSTK